MHLRMQAIWERIWKHIMEIYQINAASVIMHHLEQTFSQYMHKHTEKESQTKKTNMNFHP